MQTRTIAGQPALTCLLDSSYLEHTTDSMPTYEVTVYETWIATENELIEFWAYLDRTSVATFRWQFQPILAALRIP